MKIKLPNGIELDSEAGFAGTAQKYAESKGLSGVRVFLATHPDGQQEYVIVEGQAVVYANKNAESIGCRLDLMALDRQLPPVHSE